MQKIQIRSFHRAVGLVGMPNVGKSTLFNAMTQSQKAQAANYPFCTIEPNVAKVLVPDPRLVQLAELAQSRRRIEAQIEFVDIAGLVRGASKGEGLGNQFLENIRRVSVIAHVLRCYQDPNIIHVETTVDPIRDLETIQTELILSDLLQVERRMTSVVKKARVNKDSKIELQLLEKVQNSLQEGIGANRISQGLELEEVQVLDQLQLLTNKKALYICNVHEDDAQDGNDFTSAVQEYVADGSVNNCLIVSAALEEAAAAFDDPASQLEYLECCGLTQTGLTQVLTACRDLLQLETFYTVGEKEARAWSITRGTKAAQAAGVIHSDFEKLLIRAETIGFDDFIQSGGERQAKEKGLIRSEGKEYECQDGDVFHFLVGK